MHENAAAHTALLDATAAVDKACDTNEEAAELAQQASVKHAEDEAAAAVGEAAKLAAVYAAKHAEFSAMRASCRGHTPKQKALLGLPDNDTFSQVYKTMQEAGCAAKAAAADLATKNVAAEARKAEFMHKNAAVHTTQLDATAAVDKAADTDEDYIPTYDDELLDYLQKTVRPLQLSCYDLKSIYGAFPP